MSGIIQSPTVDTGIFSYSEKCKTPVPAVALTSGQQLVVNYALALNASGSTTILSLGERLGNAQWKAGQWVDADSPEYTDDTTDAQDLDTDDFALSTLVNNDGFVVQSLTPFNLIGLQISTAGVSGTAEISYWNGSTFVTLPSTIEAFVFTATGQTFLVFPLPLDWAVRGTNTEGLDVDKFPIRVRFTTAPSTIPLATEIWIARFFAPIRAGVTNNTSAQITPDQGVIYLGPGSSLVPYFNIASADNQVQFRFQVIS